MAAKDVPNEDEYKTLTSSLNMYGTISLALSMARETGMIGMLLEASEPVSSQDIATHLRLKERYTLETLSSLAALKVIQIEDGTGGKDGQAPRFYIPRQHRQALKSAAVFNGYISSGVRKFLDVKSCVYQDGPLGVRYTDYHFQVLEDFTELILESFADVILATPGLSEQFEKGIQAAEVGCGGGKLICHLASLFPNSKFLLTDVVPEPLQRAKENARKLKLTNVSFQTVDLMQIPEDWNERFDWILSVDVIHHLPYPLKGLEGIRRALKPGGHFSMMEMLVSSYLAQNVGNPVAAALYGLGVFHCIPDSFQKPDSEALGPCWGIERARDLVEKAGLLWLNVVESSPDTSGDPALCMCQKPF